MGLKPTHWEFEDLSPVQASLSQCHKIFVQTLLAYSEIYLILYQNKCKTFIFFIIFLSLSFSISSQRMLQITTRYFVT